MDNLIIYLSTKFGITFCVGSLLYRLWFREARDIEGVEPRWRVGGLFARRIIENQQTNERTNERKNERTYIGYR
jgi:hypothetical protein